MVVWVNCLFGNFWGMLLLEIVFGGLVLECRVEVIWLVLIGVCLVLMVDGCECLFWSCFWVCCG